MASESEVVEFGANIEDAGETKGGENISRPLRMNSLVPMDNSDHRQILLDLSAALGEVSNSITVSGTGLSSVWP